MHDYAPTSAKISFRTVPGDPIQVQMHTLANGLRLFLTVNKDEPRVYTEIAVRAGSKHDPADTTGLAHYFEHMMFKGTDRLGSLDWPKEKALLDQIEQKFEEHRREQNPQKKKELYAEIDRLSFEAAKFAAANEYDKLVSAIGAKGTNAYTWVEQTVYVNDIPSNELERWFALESERFRRPILRLFHTELETVFEEYNISQDKDFRKTMKAIQETLTPTHPYGTQTTLGRGEDLKNPSQTNIYRFFDRYYVPNNLAIVLSGDFDPEQAVALAGRHFGHYQARPLPPFRFDPQPELPSRVQRDVYGNEASWLEMGWRFPGAGSPEAKLLPLIANILYNHQAGLFDLNILQKQTLLEAYAYPRVYEDYSSLLLYGKPREGQSLEEVEKLMWEQIENLRNGHFEEWLPGAVVKDLKLSEIKSFEKNTGRAGAITNAFVLGLDWSDRVQRWEKLEKVTKADVVALAKKHLRPDNYVVVFKHHGEDKSVIKMEKPPITPIEVNRTDMSEFAQEFISKETQPVEPKFTNYKKAIQKTLLAPGIPLYTVQNPQSKLFRLYYVFDANRSNDRRLGILTQYLPYLGTADHTATELKQAFYRLGIYFSAHCQDDRFYLIGPGLKGREYPKIQASGTRNEHFYFKITGFEEFFEDGIQLMEHFLFRAKPDSAALNNLVTDILKHRENAKKDKSIILNKAMVEYAKHGSYSPFTDQLSEAELSELQPDSLIDLLRKLQQTEHEIFYYGSKSIEEAGSIIKKHHRPVDSPAPLSPAGTLFPDKHYPEADSDASRVFFVHFPMVQTEIMLVSKGTPHFDLHEYILSEWFNQYFGYGLSSIIFQEIRESKALAYATYALSMSPLRKNRAHFLRAFIGTQPDKLAEAIKSLQSILNEMPVSVSQIENARQNILQQLEGERILRSDIFWTWLAFRDRGYPEQDLNKEMYDFLQKAVPDDLVQFHKTHIKGRHYNWMILGDRKLIDFNLLGTIGPVKELSPEELFGY